MKTVKQEVHEAVERFPDELSDEMALTLRDWASIFRGMADIERGDVVEHAEVGELLKHWRESSGRQKLSGT